MWARRWAGVPRRVRTMVAVAVAVFGYGTFVHVFQLVAGGLDPYPSMPSWLGCYFVGLTVLDPAAAVLLAYRRVEGLVLACLVLVSDALANAYANYLVDQASGITAGRIGQAVITVLAAGLVVAAPSIAPWLRPVAHPPA